MDAPLCPLHGCRVKVSNPGVVDSVAGGVWLGVDVACPQCSSIDNRVLGLLLNLQGPLPNDECL